MFYTLQQPLAFDRTGKNKDNLIKDEPHVLTDSKTRALVPDRGLFYTYNLMIFDEDSGLGVLEPEVDYQLVELNQHLTYSTGIPVYAGIIILNPRVSNNVILQYQAVGGVYATDNTAIANLYQSFINDTRPVDWNNILNKPSEFPPTDHFHILNDVIGWEPIIYQLERLRMGMTCSQVDILFATLNRLLNRFQEGELPKIVSSDKVVQYDALMYVLTRRKLLSSTWIDCRSTNMRYGGMGFFEIDTSEFEVGTVFTWEFFKQDFAPIFLPIVKSGSIKGNGSVVKVPFYIPAQHIHEDETIYIGVKVENGTWEKKGSHDSDFINILKGGVEDKRVSYEDEYDAVTYRLSIQRSVEIFSLFGYMSNANLHLSDISNDPDHFKSNDLSNLYFLGLNTSPCEAYYL